MVIISGVPIFRIFTAIWNYAETIQTYNLSFIPTVHAVCNSLFQHRIISFYIIWIFLSKNKKK